MYLSWYTSIQIQGVSCVWIDKAIFLRQPVIPFTFGIVDFYLEYTSRLNVCVKRKKVDLSYKEKHTGTNSAYLVADDMYRACPMWYGDCVFKAVGIV